MKSQLKPGKKLTFNDRTYKVTVGYYSHFWEVDYLKNTKARIVISKVQQTYILCSHNGSQYTTLKKKRQHQVGSQESQETDAKGNTDRKGFFSLTTLQHRNIPPKGLESSPEQRPRSQRTKTLLPTKGNLLQPSTGTKDSTLMQLK